MGRRWFGIEWRSVSFVGYPSPASKTRLPLPEDWEREGKENWD